MLDKVAYQPRDDAAPMLVLDSIALAQLNPVYSAKEVATLDIRLLGRVSGAQREELMTEAAALAAYAASEASTVDLRVAE